MFKIKRGDNVVVLSGKDKGKVGSVIKVFMAKHKKFFKVFVTGLNLVKRHCKGNTKKNFNGGILNLESSFALSNVAIYNNILNKSDTIISKVIDGRRYRVYKSTGERF
jgi:large subunit ribosomal protein L24